MNIHLNDIFGIIVLKRKQTVTMLSEIKKIYNDKNTNQLNMINKYLGKSQFYYRNTTRYNQPPNVVPDFVDFEYSFDEELQLITQVRKRDTLDYLELIYKESYNVG